MNKETASFIIAKKAETTQVSIKGCVNEQNAVYPRHGISLDNKKEGSRDTWYDMDTS